jgi:uncharacterized protein RhaS with RHS repeats
MEGRFISKDPIGFTGGDINLYGYVGNNPINYIDPLGLWGLGFTPYTKQEIEKMSKLPITTCEISGPIKINPKIYAQLEKQLAQAGAGSILKALRSAERTLQEHIDKLPELEFKSQVEGTIRNVESQISTIRQFLQDNKLW